MAKRSTLAKICGWGTGNLRTGKPIPYARFDALDSPYIYLIYGIFLN